MDMRMSMKQDAVRIPNNRKKMKILSLIWIVFFVELLLVLLGRMLLGDIGGIDTILILFHICSVFILISTMPKHVSYSLFIAYILRIGAMIFDCTTLTLSNMNTDTLGYYEHGVLCIEDFAAANRYGGMYSRILGLVFRITGASRLIAEYLNVLLGLSIVLVVFYTLFDAGVSKKKLVFSLWLISVFPYSIYNSVVTYRETFISFFCILSCYWAFEWYVHRNVSRMMLTIISILVASSFHAGIIVMAIGYAILFAFYLREKDKLRIRRDTLFIMLSVLAVAFYVVVVNPNLFFRKLVGVLTDSTAIVAQFNRSSGGSAYLTWLKVNTPLQAIIYSPIKALYLMFSPLPTDWRGIIDIITFCIDSMVYFIMVKDIVIKRNESKYSVFVNAMSFSLLILSLVFGIGTWTAGTAVRHRNKVFGSMLIVWMLTDVERKNEKVLEIE